MTDLTKLTIAEARDKLAARDFTATELTESYLGAIETGNEALNAFIAVTGDIAREQAKASDAKIAAGEARRWKVFLSALKTFTRPRVFTLRRVLIFLMASSLSMSPRLRRTCLTTAL